MGFDLFKGHHNALRRTDRIGTLGTFTAPRRLDHHGFTLGAKRVLRGGVGEVKDLVLAAIVPVDGGSLASLSPGLDVSHENVVLGGILGEIDGLAYGIVTVLLKGCLHLDVVLGRTVHTGHKNLPDPQRQLCDASHGSFLDDLPHHLVQAISFVTGLSESRIKMFVDIVQSLALVMLRGSENAPIVVGQGKIGLYLQVFTSKTKISRVSITRNE